MNISEEQKILQKLYEVQDILLKGNNTNEYDEKYIIIAELVSYLENKIIEEAGFIGI